MSTSRARDMQYITVAFTLAAAVAIWVSQVAVSVALCFVAFRPSTSLYLRKWKKRKGNEVNKPKPHTHTHTQHTHP